jgi:hypothetical protein
MRKVAADRSSAVSPSVAWTDEDRLRIEGVLALVTDGLRHAVERTRAMTDEQGGAA